MGNCNVLVYCALDVFDRYYQKLTQRLPCIYIDSEECVGDASTWDRGYGKCPTYAVGATNYAYCNTDFKDGHYAFQVCQECGSCVVSGTFNSTVYNRVYKIIKVNII